MHPAWTALLLPSTVLRLVLAGVLVGGLATALVQTLPRQDEPGTTNGYAPVTDARLRAPDPADWLMYRRTYDGWGLSPDSARAIR